MRKSPLACARVHTQVCAHIQVTPSSKHTKFIFHYDDAYGMSREPHSMTGCVWRNQRHLSINKHGLLIKKKIYAVWIQYGLGHAGERYLHIPEVPWCKVQVGLKWTVTNGEWWCRPRKYLVSRRPPLTEKKAFIDFIHVVTTFSRELCKHLDLFNSRRKQSGPKKVANNSWDCFGYHLIYAQATGCFFLLPFQLA